MECERAINLSTREGLSQPAPFCRQRSGKDAEVPAPLYRPKPSLWELMGTRRPSWVSAELGLTHGGSVELAPPRWALGRAGPLVRTSGRCSKGWRRSAGKDHCRLDPQGSKRKSSSALAMAQANPSMRWTGIRGRTEFLMHRLDLFIFISISIQRAIRGLSSYYCCPIKHKGTCDSTCLTAAWALYAFIRDGRGDQGI